jgi:hypothetical protein
LGLLNEKDMLQAEKGKENGEDETLLVTFLNEKQKKRRTIRKREVSTKFDQQSTEGYAHGSR